MKPKLYILLLTLFLVYPAGRVTAQEPTVDTVGSLTGIQVETSVDKAEIYIGDLITYTVAITYDSTIELIPPPLGANLGAFDVKDYQPDIETRLPDGRIKSETVFKVSTFTTGDYVIPPVPVIFIMPDSTRKAVLAEPVPIKVLSMLENAGDSVDIHPLKAQYEFPRDYSRYYIWGALALVVVIGAVILIWSMIRRKKLKEEPVDMRPPWEIAFEKLAVLKEKNLISQERYREYYFELTEIYRGFLGRVYEIDVLEMTTEEFMERFEKIELPGNIYRDSMSMLRYADLVKFAKQVPESGRPEVDLQAAHDMIETVRFDRERKAQIDVHIDQPGGKPMPETTEASR
ncbi:MAG: hypothetical protein JXA92_12095 [candidate division Zixibacteria bacterium]|nr:hypothetical protein [candidate division Zixibacteria bacterium]